MSNSTVVWYAQYEILSDQKLARKKKAKGTNTPLALYWHNVSGHADKIAHSF